MDTPRLSRTYRRVIQLELNEISRPIIDRLVAEGAVPAFAAVERNFARLETVSEQRYEQFEPWIQWVTAHTGKTFAEHGVFRLGDARHSRHAQTWDVLSEYGIESGVLGSMNARRGRTRGGVFFPDPWAKENETFPESLRPLWSLISRQVQGHAVAQPTIVDAILGASACLRMRVSPSLQAQIGAQLVRQRLDRRTAWRMAGLFDRFLFEIFRHVLRSTRFGYYTLFLNAVAHYQHHFWRQFDKTGFDPRLECPDCRPTDDPIRYGYLMYDRIIGEVLDLARDPDTLVVIASGLSQVPYRERESEGGSNYWRLKAHAAFAQKCDLQASRVYPMMSRDWQLEFANAELLSRARGILLGMRVGGEPLFQVDQNQPLGLFVETKLTRGVGAEDIVFEDGRRLAPFHDCFACVAIKSGHHVGTGVCWLSDAAARAPRTIPLGALHHVVLQALGAQAPDEDRFVQAPRG